MAAMVFEEAVKIADSFSAIRGLFCYLHSVLPCIQRGQVTFNPKQLMTVILKRNTSTTRVVGYVTVLVDC